MKKGIRISPRAIESKNMRKAYQARKINSSQPKNSSIDHVMFLQRTIGNLTVQKLISKGTLQAKLSIGRPGDIYEQEADRVADAVLRLPQPQAVDGHRSEPSIQRLCTSCEEKELQRQQVGDEDKDKLQMQPIEEDEEKLRKQPIEKEDEKNLQTKGIPGSSAEINPAIESRVQAIRGSGQYLPETVRAYFEPRFGSDFSGVRIHSDSRAAEGARELNARAFTIGSDIVFGAGEYNPGNSAGKHLLAHELTHVVQQRGNTAMALRQSPGIGAERVSQVSHRIIQLASTVQDGETYYDNRAEAESNVPTHVSPKNCFVWRDGPSSFPWRVIPGTGCAHWVAHQLGVSDTPGCYVGNAIRVSQVTSGKTAHSLQDAQVGDIWTNSGGSHTGIVRSVNRNAANQIVSADVEHDSSGQGGVVTNTFTSGNFYR